MPGLMQRPFVALGLLAMGMAVIPLNDAFIKLMSDRLPLAEIVFVRGVLALLIMAVFSRGISSMLELPRRDFWQFFGRGMCLVIAMALYFIPLGSLPLPTVISIFFVSPLLITLLSVPLLGERIGIHRILSVCMGLAGVLLIIRPGTADFKAESVIVFGAALSYALFQIWTRRLKAVGNLSAMVSVQQICYIVAALPVLLVNSSGQDRLLTISRLISCFARRPCRMARSCCSSAFAPWPFFSCRWLRQTPTVRSRRRLSRRSNIRRSPSR